MAFYWKIDSYFLTLQACMSKVNMNNSLLIVDDESIIRNLLSRMMELEGYEVHAADCRTSALQAVERYKPQVVLCDVFLPDGNGIDMIADMKRIYPGCEVVLLTAHGNIGDGVQAIKNGAFDYIVKGDDNNKIIPIISRAFDKALKNGNANKTVHMHTFDTILGHSEALQRVITLARKVAATDVPVLITGETGTGKELFAQSIHEAGTRHTRPFMAINCSAFSRDLLESELFGHCAGAFTGALKDKKGLFEVANKGTVFLDEVGEMDFSLQAKLLRVLETGEYIKIGDTKPTKVDVRIISATNRDLNEEIDNGRFRGDLFYRLSVFHLALPPLRDRREDIPLLATSFENRIAAKLNKQVDGMSAQYLRAIESAEWRGNIRELKNVIERSVIVCDKRLEFEDLPLDLQQQFADSATHPAAEASTSTDAPTMDLATIEHRHIARVLQYTHGNKTATARLLKIGLTTLYRKIEEYAIEA